MAVNTLSTRGTTSQGKVVFGSFDDRDTLIWLKDLALEPCNKKSSHQGHCNQMLKVCKFMNAGAKSPQKKRKFNQYMNNAKFSASKEKETNQPHKKFLPSRGNNLPRLVIPIGPRFQAKVPKWEGKTNIRRHNSNDDLKWLGTQIWPMSDFTETNTNGSWKGRPDSCYYDFPRSLDCVQQHVEAKELLKSKIGTTCSSLKFDEMGEDVSNSWTLEDQKKFESLLKLNSPSNTQIFGSLPWSTFHPNL
ncbi:AT-rich interactive domain-containing protein 1-like [Gastrolobium bilobum]|uniref:AT-rich interactive domain-containing protein 1-like n=1 Tax=Gastrolobium bilobum TaxID=150636 RepID=UPI002AB18850|nr:AT-rich interactive domain-containing protein 1-like [Gastrolobium bilobum]